MSAASSPARQNQPEGITLVQAAGCGDVGTVEVLIAAGADINSATQHGMTALMSAAANGHLGLVCHLLERGADINAKRCDSLDALALAVFFGHLHVVRELLGRGADLKAKSRFGTSPEMWATTRGFYDIAQILTEAKTPNSRETPSHRNDESNEPPGSPSPEGGSGQPAWGVGSPELTGAREPILPEAFFSDEGLSDETLSHATEASPIPAQILPDSTHDDEWTLGSNDSSDVTIESPASVWNMPDEEHRENQVQPRSSGTTAEPMSGEVTHNDAGIFAPAITQRPRALPVEQQPSPIYSTYVAKPRYHHKSKSRKLVRCLTYMTSDWRRLTVVTLIVMLLCGLGTLAFLKLLSPSTPSRAAKAANVAEPSALALPHYNPENDLRSFTREEQTSSKPATNDASSEQSVHSAKKGDDRGGPEVDRIEPPSYSAIAKKPLRKANESVTGARPKLRGPRAGNSHGVLETMSPKRETQAISRPSFKSASVSPKRMKSRNAADLGPDDNGVKAPAPAPLSIEVQRPRSVAARNDSSTPAASPARNTKTKVIQWP